MALQTSGEIKFSEIQTEFGGSHPITMTEYYGAATGIPASGEISMDDFYGASNVIIFQLVNPAAYSQSAGTGYYLAGSKNGQYSTANVEPATNIGSMVPDPGNSIIPSGHVTGSSITNWVLNELTWQTFGGSNRIYVHFRNGSDTTVSTNSTYWLNVTRYNITSAPFSSITISDSSAFNTTHTYTFSSFTNSSSANFPYGSYTTQVGWVNPTSDPVVATAYTNILYPASLGNGTAWIKISP